MNYYTFREKKEKLVFLHLYDDKYGVVVKATRRWERPKLIMPLGFVPRVKQSYDCFIMDTVNGVFVFNNVQYDLSFATLKKEGSFIDVLDHEFGEKESLESPLAMALSNLKGIKDKLPEKHELVILEVGTDNKGGLMFKPHYVDKDPAVGGKSSMRFFHQKGKTPISYGEKWRAKVVEVITSTKMNKKGAFMINVNIELIERVEKIKALRMAS